MFTNFSPNIQSIYNEGTQYLACGVGPRVRYLRSIDIVLEIYGLLICKNNY